MEIVSYVLEGELAHKDSMGTGQAGAAAGVIRPGDVQRMSAGRGVQHSEFNHAAGRDHPFPADLDRAERARHRARLRAEAFRCRVQARPLRLVASPDGRDGSVTIHADASIYSGLFEPGERAELALDPARRTYVHVVRGSVDVNGRRLGAGDALGLEQERKLRIDNAEDAEVLVFDLQ